MSAKDAEEMMLCASCGAAEGDDIKLKKCTACHLVRYCSVKCQEDHRSTHEEECKKRVAELHDRILFKQPESTHLGDCPICCLPLSSDIGKSVLASCCSKRICDGCNFANKRRELEGRLEHKCPFCRKSLPTTLEEIVEQLMKRVEANDPVAMREMGLKASHEGDYKSALEYGTRAVALGDTEAHYNLSFLYRDGKGVDMDKKKELHHLTEAAIAGHSDARRNLGFYERKNGHYDRAAKHWIISAKLGHHASLKCVTELFNSGHVSRDDFDAAFRGYQIAINATKSPQRAEAAEYTK